MTIAYDNSSPSQRALEQFAEFSWRGAVEVQVLSVVHFFPQFPGEGEAMLHDQVKHDVEQAGERVIEVVDRLQSEHVRATGKVVTADNAGEGVVKAAKAFGSDLIVMGNTGRSLIPRLLLGSVSAYVQRHASQSVWIAR